MLSIGGEGVQSVRRRRRFRETARSVARELILVTAVDFVARTIEVCMGMGIPILVEFPWDSHGNGSSFELLMGMGMGIVLMGIGIAYFIKLPPAV